MLFPAPVGPMRLEVEVKIKVTLKYASVQVTHMTILSCTGMPTLKLCVRTGQCMYRTQDLHQAQPLAG